MPMPCVKPRNKAIRPRPTLPIGSSRRSESRFAKPITVRAPSSRAPRSWVWHSQNCRSRRCRRSSRRSPRMSMPCFRSKPRSRRGRAMAARRRSGCANSSNSGKKSSSEVANNFGVCIGAGRFRLRREERSRSARRQANAQGPKGSVQAARATARTMNHFAYRLGTLHAEAVDLNTLAEKVGTPFYCYSTATLERHFRVFAESLPQDSLVAYSVKANGNIAVLRTLARLGAGADVVSGGELKKALRAGVPAERIVFSGVGKTKAEMKLALEAGIYQFNVESESELLALSEVATA